MSTLSTLKKYAEGTQAVYEDYLAEFNAPDEPGITFRQVGKPNPETVELFASRAAMAEGRLGHYEKTGELLSIEETAKRFG